MIIHILPFFVYVYYFLYIDFSISCRSITHRFYLLKPLPVLQIHFFRRTISIQTSCENFRNYFPFSSFLAQIAKILSFFHPNSYPADKNNTGYPLTQARGFLCKILTADKINTDCLPTQARCTLCKILTADKTILTVF